MRYRRLLLGALVVNLGLGASYLALASNPHRAQGHGDFVAFYTAWTMVREGQGARLYHFDDQAAQQRTLLHGRVFPGGLLPFVNPPHVALTFAPLAGLSLPRAAAVWAGGQLALLLWLLRLLTRGRPPFEGWLVGSAVVAFPPLLQTVELGAFSLLLLVTLLKLHQSLLQKREHAAGAWLVVGSLKPQLVALPALAVLMSRRFRSVAVAVAALALVVVACSAALGAPIWPDFARALLAVHANYRSIGLHPEAMYNLKGAILGAFGPAAHAIAPSVAMGGWLAACAATLWIWRAPSPADQPQFELRLALTIVLGALFGLHLYPQDGLQLVAAAALYDSYLRRSGRARTPFAALALATPVLWFVTELLLPPPPVRFPTLLMGVLAVWMAHELRRSTPLRSPG